MHRMYYFLLTVLRILMKRLSQIKEVWRKYSEKLLNEDKDTSCYECEFIRNEEVLKALNSTKRAKQPELEMYQK